MSCYYVKFFKKRENLEREGNHTSVIYANKIVASVFMYFLETALE